MQKTGIISALGVVIVLTAASQVVAEEDRRITVYKTPLCGCCKVWTEEVERAGYTVSSRDLEDLSSIKRQAAVPEQLEACHTAVLGKYVIEGHVPIEAIEKLLAEQPEVRGIAVPGMPAGSLGMGSDPSATYSVFAFSPDTKVAPTVFFEAGQ